MKAAVLTVGTELLMGYVENTNTTYLDERLNALGISVLYNLSVGDNAERLTGLLGFLEGEVDLVITTGGLGPTEDDLTRETIASFTGRPLAQDEEVLNRLIERFRSSGYEMTPNNLKQALVPAGAEVLPNPKGTAPGLFLEKNERFYALLPGPPREMIPLFENEVVPRIRDRVKQVISSVYFKLFGIGESQLESRLEDLMSGRHNPSLATYAKPDALTLRLTASGPSEEENLRLMQPVREEILRRVGHHVYSEKDEQLAETVVALLARARLTLSLAESCTGGLLSHEIVSVPGASSVYLGGAVTYSNDEKIRALGVKADEIERHGAVSAEVASAMVRGIASATGSRVAIAITGVAGPDGGTASKPVGLVYIALSIDGRVQVEEHRFSGGRSRIRHRSALQALFHLYQALTDRQNWNNMDINGG
jgi:nicotinamide-nucleotide amidase